MRNIFFPHYLSGEPLYYGVEQCWGYSDLQKIKEQIYMYIYICFKAEDEGFKPPIPVNGYTGFRVQRIRSLCQSSINENSNQMQKTNCKV